MMADHRGRVGVGHVPSGVFVLVVVIRMMIVMIMMMVPATTATTAAATTTTTVRISMTNLNVAWERPHR